MKITKSLSLAIFILLVTAGNTHAVSFQGLWTNAYVTDISGDGSTVVGGRFGLTNTGYYWRASTGIVAIPSLSQGGSDSFLWGVSYDGSVAAGTTTLAFKRRAATWTPDGGYSVLPLSSGNIFRDNARAISGDSTTVVGHHQPIFTSQPDTPLVWRDRTLSTPNNIPLDVDLSGVSHDGSVIIGNRGRTFSNDSDGIVWSAQLGYQVLHALPGDDRVRAYGISADGNVVVGDSSIGTGLTRSYAWSTLTGVRELVMLDDDRFNESSATDASHDGSVIVGTLYGDESAAFYWTEETGMILLQDMLEDQYGLILTGWQLTSAAGVSDDGRTFTGRGISPLGVDQVWVASTAVPLPGALLFYLSGLGLLILRNSRKSV